MPSIRTCGGHATKAQPKSIGACQMRGDAQTDVQDVHVLRAKQSSSAGQISAPFARKGTWGVGVAVEHAIAWADGLNSVLPFIRCSTPLGRPSQDDNAPRHRRTPEASDQTIPPPEHPPERSQQTTAPTQTRHVDFAHPTHDIQIPRRRCQTSKGSEVRRRVAATHCTF